MQNLTATEAFDLILATSGQAYEDMVLVETADGDCDWTEAASLDPERLYLDISDYIASAGRRPSGHGAWAFALADSEKFLTVAGENKVLWSTGDLAEIAEDMPAGRWVLGS